MKIRVGFGLCLVTVLSSFGCAPTVDAGTTSSGDTISPSDDPNKLLGLPQELSATFSFQLGDNIQASDIGGTFGVDKAHIPYPDTYWPMASGGIDNAWNQGAPSALEKYMTLADVSDLAKGKAWENANHGPGRAGVQSWWGHCPGWTGAALTNAPLTHAVDVTENSGSVVACNPGDAGCTHFEIGDINALEAEVFVDADTRFIGNRCDTAAADIKRDEYGRIIRNGGGCQGLNAGALLVLVGNLMKQQHIGFAIDAQNDSNTNQIWNQPSYAYKVYAYQTLTEVEAANLVASGSKTGPLTSYPWNASAKAWALVDLGLQWVSENGPNTQVLSGADSTSETRVYAVIELDGGDTQKIVGGEYLDDSMTAADRLTAPPFVWMAAGAGPEDLSADVDGTHHNPYVKPSIVSQLVTLAQ